MKVWMWGARAVAAWLAVCWILGPPCAAPRGATAAEAEAAVKTDAGSPPAATAAPAATVVPPFSTTCFDDFRQGQEFPGSDALLRLLEPVSGELREGWALNRKAVVMGQLLRLKEPWGPDTALRLSLLDHRLFQIYLWNGDEGLVLCHRGPTGGRGPNQQPPENWVGWSEWAAYGAQGKPPLPGLKNLALWATDEGRYARSGGGTVELHYQAGQVILTRGNLRLLAAPLAAPPREVLLDGYALVRGLAVFRSGSVPPPDPPDATLTRIDDLSRLTWQRELDAEATVDVTPEGVELKVPRGKWRAAPKESLVTAELPRPDEPGPVQYVFQLSQPTAGASLFLADQEGRVLCRVAYFRAGSHAATFALLRGNVPRDGRNFDRSNHFQVGIVPFAGPRQWLRLIVAAGVARCWTSGDGLAWSMVGEKPLANVGGCRRVGLACQLDRSSNQPASIQLNRIEVRRLDALADVAPAGLAKQVRLPAERSDATRWRREIDEACPAGVRPELWRRAAIVAALPEVAGAQLGQQLLWQLLDDVLAEPAGAEELAARLRLLREAALMLDTSDAEGSARLAECYARLGQQGLGNRDPAPWSRLCADLLAAPILPRGGPPPFPSGLVRDEVLRAVFDERWGDVADICRRLQYWCTRPPQDRGESQPPLRSEAVSYVVEWAAAEAVAQLRDHGPGLRADAAQPAGKAVAAIEKLQLQDPGGPPHGLHGHHGRGRGPRQTFITLRSNHPLIERLSRDEYNVAAELQGALASQAYREACQIINTADPDLTGLIPNAADPALLTSLPATIYAALADMPELARTMQERFGAVGQLRLKQAVAAGDARGVEAVAGGFPGTSAGAEAQGWLGDRELAAGHFDSALAAFAEARSLSPPPSDRPWRVRERLAAALLGRNFGEPVDWPIELGDAHWQPGDFENLLAKLRAAHGGSPGADNEGREGRPADLPPGAYHARPWHAAKSGTSGQAFRHDLGFDGHGDWGPWQTALAGAGELLLLSLPSGVEAFDRTTGRVRWRWRSDADEGRWRWLPGALQPAASAGRIFVRRLTSTDPLLVCLNAADGSLAWTSAPGRAVVSDPLVIDSQVCAVVTAQTSPDTLAVALGRFDAESGQLLGESPLVELRDVWGAPLSAAATAVAGRIVVSVGGCVVACDLAGRVHWVRRQIYLPGPKEGRSEFQARQFQVHAPPLVAQGRVLVCQPGVWRLDCLDLASGRLLWFWAEPELRRLVSAAQGQVLVETSDALAALDTAHGKLLWTHPLPGPLAGGVFDPPEVLMYRAAAIDSRLGDRRGAAEPDGPRPWWSLLRGVQRSDRSAELVWLDRRTGRRAGSGPLTWPDRRSAVLGPTLLPEPAGPRPVLVGLQAEGDALWEMAPGE